MTRQEIKSALLDSFWGTERGLSATSETRAEINELITQLEAVTPIAEPTEVRLRSRLSAAAARTADPTPCHMTVPAGVR